MSNWLTQMESGKTENEKTSGMAELNQKLDTISRQLEAIQNLQIDFHEMLTDFVSSTAQWIEERRKNAEEKQKKFETMLNYQSVLLGFLIGILGNLFVSYLVEALKVSRISPSSWIIATVISVVLLFIAAYPFYRKIEESLKEE